MKVATKFALAFVAIGLLSAGVYSSVAASREVSQVEQTVTEDLAGIGETMSASVMTVLGARRGSEGARARCRPRSHQ